MSGNEKVEAPLHEIENIQHDNLIPFSGPDLLLVNLKTADFVGHQYGPDSPEMRETLAEQDRQLARILEALEKKAGANRVVVVITADHCFGLSQRLSAMLDSPSSCQIHAGIDTNVIPSTANPYGASRMMIYGTRKARNELQNRADSDELFLSLGLGHPFWGTHKKMTESDE